MKKLAPAAIALVVVLCAGLFFLWRDAPFRARAAEIAPPEAILFAQLPDILRTVQRWPDTSLAHLWNEPEVQAFLALPLAKMPALLRAQEQVARLRRIVPREAFVAIVGFDGPTPRFVAGLNFAGRKSEVAVLVAEPWTEWKKAWPAGKAELLHRPEWEIETYAFEGKLLAGSFHAGWYFMANDLAALEATLARCEGGGNAGIGSTAALRRAAAPLPAELDAFVFAQPGEILERLGALWAGQTPIVTKSPAEATPIAWGVKLEGAQIRDTIFAADIRGADVPLRRSTQRLTAPESLLYATFLLPPRMDLPPATWPLLALLAPSPWLALQEESVSWADFVAAFGPEGSVVLDWPAAADAPSISFVFQVRDAARAAGLVESLTGPSAKGAQWQRREQAGVIHYQARGDRQGGTAPAVALMPGFVVLGAQGHAVRTVAARLPAGGADLTQSPPFHEIAARVKTPTVGFAYLDLPALAGRSYEALRPFLGMSLALSPETSPYFDPSRLPSAAALARHLGPSVYSHTARDGGISMESVGSLSLSQTLAGLAAVAWSSAAPSVRRLGKNEAAAPVAPSLPTRTPPIRAGRESQKAAETSRESENADETSQIRASHP